MRSGIMITKKVFLLMVGLEVLSLGAFVYKDLNLPFLIVIGLVTFLISLKRLDWGIYILFGELFVGSRGRMLEYGIVSLRMVIFGAVLVAWLVSKIRNSKFEILNKFQIPNSKFQILYWLLLLVLVLGILNGALSGNGYRNVFLDANGYFYLLIFPAVLAGIKNREQIENIFKILATAIVVIAAKTLFLFLWFAFDFNGVGTLYHWVIDTKAGEITGYVGTASRIFLASQFWALVGIFIFGIRRESRNIFVIAAAVLGVLLSLSRSFWLGGVAAAVFGAVVLLFYLKVRFWAVVKLAGIVVLVAILEIAFLYGLVSLGGGKVSSTIASRIENPVTEAAGSARLLLLPELVAGIKQSPVIGSGFGKEVRYSSFLPNQITPDNPEGVIASYAFEWGYLDMLLKFGALGFVIYLLFIAYIFRLGWANLQFLISNFQTNSKLKMQNLGILTGLVALLILNITTPYLNHPLGIGYLILSLISFKVHGETAG